MQYAKGVPQVLKSLFAAQIVSSVGQAIRVGLAQRNRAQQQSYYYQIVFSCRSSCEQALLYVIHIKMGTSNRF